MRKDSPWARAPCTGLCKRSAGAATYSREGENYRLGLKVVELASVLLNDLDIRKLAEPILLSTAAILGEAAHLVLLDEGEAIYIDTKASSQKIINIYSKVGRRAPVHATAVGKAMLAFLPEEEARAILFRKGLPRLTSTTITNLEELMAQLKEIRKTKIAHDVEENELGIYCVGTPVFNYSGKLAGGISVSGPANRMKEKDLEYLASIVKKTGEELSAWDMSSAKRNSTGCRVSSHKPLLQSYRFPLF